MKTSFQKFTAILAVFSTGVTAQAAVSTIGGTIYNPTTGHNYFLVGLGTWSQTEAFATSLGGHLVTINDAAENNWLTSNFVTTNPTYNFWMGLNDLDNNGTWTWISGESVSYLNWAPGEPNFSSEKVGNLLPTYAANTGKWNNAPDVIGSGIFYGIVEVPEPTVFALGMISCACFAVVRSRRHA